MNVASRTLFFFFVVIVRRNPLIKSSRTPYTRSANDNRKWLLNKST